MVSTQQTYLERSDAGTAPVSYLKLFFSRAVIATAPWGLILVLLAALFWILG
jgi:hypothetical protein